MEEIAGCEDVAPSDFAAISDDYANNALALQAGSGAGETPLQLIDEAVNGAADACALINLSVRLRRRFGRDGVCQSFNAETRSGSRRRGGGSGGGCSCSGATGDRGPYLGLLLLDGGLLSDAGMNDRARCTE